MKKRKTHLVTDNIKLKPKTSNYRKFGHIFLAIIAVAAVIVTAYIGYRYYQTKYLKPALSPEKQVASTKPPTIDTGKILKVESTQSFTTAQTLAQIKETNRNFDLPVNRGYTRQVIQFNSSDGTTSDLALYAKVYIPQSLGVAKAPVLAFATGTTGIGDECAASLEVASKRNWANYDSLMAAYASQGYIVIQTDYEGMRDVARLHHYMVGELEGRVVLDSVRALRNLNTTSNSIDTNAQFLGGYSQGGHAAYWADAIASKYAPELTIKGVVGFGPVTSVSQTLTDAITANANINWFGPFVLMSYPDWYKRNYPINRILQPKWTTNLASDVQKVCIDNVNQFYPNNVGANRSATVYTQEFINAVKTNTLSSNRLYAQFAADMNANIVGPVMTKSAKLINQGIHDNVVLPAQNQAGFNRLCASGNQVVYKEYNTSPYAVQGYNPKGLVDHYQTMNASFRDTIVWMQGISSGGAIPNQCKNT